MKIETVEIDKLKPFERNPKKHPESQLKKLEKSISEFGWTNPILVTKDNMVMAGHARLEAAKRLNIGQVPVIYLDLPYEKAIAYVIADNRLAELAETNTAQLSELLGELSALPDFDIELTGFDVDEVVALNPAEVVEDNFDAGAALDAIDEPVTKRGDIILLGKHRLMCGDSTDAGDVERLMDGKKADMVFTDPPYGMNYTSGTWSKERKEKMRKIENDGIDEESFIVFLKTALDIIKLNINETKDQYICTDWKVFHLFRQSIILSGQTISNLVVWNKIFQTQALNKFANAHEFIIFIGNNKYPYLDINVWDCKREFDPNHPTPKPIKLVSKAINYSSKTNEIILDAFIGSGSTLIACEQTNRICYGCEISEAYCDVIVKRWEDFTGQKAIRPEHKPLEKH